MHRITVKDMAIIAVLTALLFVQEQLLSFLPNVQLTVFLIVLYSKALGLIKTSLIVIIHTILDNLFMASFNIVYFPFMLIGWMIIPIIICSLFKNCESPLLLALMGILFSFIYSWLFIIPNVIILDVNALDYFIADIIYEIILAVSSFITILWLYKPCRNVLNNIMNKEAKN